jgi:hypothetical protein
MDTASESRPRARGPVPASRFPRFKRTGFLALPARRSSEEFWHIARADLDAAGVMFDSIEHFEVDSFDYNTDIADPSRPALETNRAMLEACNRRLAAVTLRPA